MIYLYAGCTGKQPLPDLRENFDHRSVKPFGTYTAKKIIQLNFDLHNIQVTKKRFSEIPGLTTDSNTVYFCVARNLYTNEEDAQAMLDYIYNGNTLLISAADIDSILLTKVLCRQVKSSHLSSKAYYQYTNVSLQPYPGEIYQYYYRPFQSYFSEIRAENSFPVGFNENSKPNSFVLFWGRGRLILHCEPRALSNYFLLKDDNYKYLEQLLSFIDTDVKTIYWDDYFRNHNVKKNSGNSVSAFDELQKHPPLASALWIFLFMLGLYILFNSKRRQRIIPEIKQVRNSSVSFTETIARLYLQHKDNKNIAEKMITYFNEHLRKHYFINPGLSDQDFISALSRKSGLGMQQTSELFDAIEEINKSYEVDDEQLLSLNSHFQQFYKNKN